MDAVSMDLFDAWTEEVAAGRATSAEAVQFMMDGVWPEADDTDEVVAEATPALAGVELVIWYREKIGRKIESADLANGGTLGTQLYDAAVDWIKTVDADKIAWSEWLVKLQTKLRKYGNQTSLSQGEAKGVLNSLYASETRQNGPKASQPILTPVAPQQPQNRVTVDADDAAWDAWCGHRAVEVSKGFFTLVRDDGSHRTFKVGAWKPDNRSADPDARLRWLGLLTGPHNTSDYETVGFQRDSGEIVMIRQYRNSPETKAMVELVLCGTREDRDGMRKAYAVESGNCAMCNRVLTDPVSIEVGIGPECRKRGWM